MVTYLHLLLHFLFIEPCRVRTFSKRKENPFQRYQAQYNVLSRFVSGKIRKFFFCGINTFYENFLAVFLMFVFLFERQYALHVYNLKWFANYIYERLSPFFRSPDYCSSLWLSDLCLFLCLSDHPSAHLTAQYIYLFSYLCF